MWEWSGYCTFVGAPGRKYIKWSQQTRKKSCCDSCFMDLTWLLERFDKVVQHISRPLQNNTKLKFDQDFRACWSFCFQLKVLSQSTHCPGLHKLCHPTIRDGSRWSKFGARGEHGDVFLFSNLGALWFSENIIRYSLHIGLREVKNNLFSFKHSYLWHFSWRF